MMEMKGKRVLGRFQETFGANSTEMIHERRLLEIGVFIRQTTCPEPLAHEKLDTSFYDSELLLGNEKNWGQIRNTLRFD